MRTIQATEIEQIVARLCVKANRALPGDIQESIANAIVKEDWPPAKETLALLQKNAACANPLPLCQDTGIACVFLTIGQHVHIEGSVEEAVNAGVRRGYGEGYLRKSVVADPLRRVNTQDNTPAMLYIAFGEGDRLQITVAPKGFGSENMSRIAMLHPADGVEGVKSFVVETVRLAGANPCPPVVVGVGLGGTFDKAALLAKQALLRPVHKRHDDPYYAALETELLAQINDLGIGPQGFGGRTTALGVQIETLPTHIAGLPCAVNINCHATRHETEML